MSKNSIKSKVLSTRFSLRHKRKYEGKNKNLKPFGFCCSIDDFDPLTQYDKIKSLYKPSALSMNAVNECPVLKFQTQYSDQVDFEQKKRIPKNRQLDIGDHKRKLYAKHKKNSQNVNKLHKQRNPQRGRNLQKQYNPYNPHNPRDFEDLQDVEDLYDEKLSYFLRGPLQWYLEDEIGTGKDIIWKQKQRTYNEEMDKNIVIGRKKVKAIMNKQVNMFCPRWYQDFSIDQVKNLMMLQCVMHKDYEEMVTGRTQRILIAIGIVSTFFTVMPDVIKNLQKSSNCNVIDFLREIYKMLTGNYFEEEEYKQFYDCNERIILTAIAFLSLPEAVVELHKRLPPVTMPKLPAKPVPPMIPIRRKMSSPYEEELFTRPDWVLYCNSIERWRERYQLTPIPKIILPPAACILIDYKKTNDNSNGEENRHVDANSAQIEQKHTTPIKEEKNRSKNLELNSLINAEEDYLATTISNSPPEMKQKRNLSMKEQQKDNVYTRKKQKDNIPPKEKYVTGNKTEEVKQNIKGEPATNSNVIQEEPVIENSEKSLALALPQIPDENKLFDFTINGISEKPGPVEYKICGLLQPPQPNKKSWLDEKHAHYIISGASEDPPTCPVTYEMTGVANVTPTNSDERFFAVLKLGDGPKKIYPSGRKNLSQNWQEWLQNADEEFRKVEREANKMIKSIEAITRLVFPDPTCDSCCSCRQTRKSYFKAKETKSPYFVIDTITEDNKKNKYIVGSMAMHSPAPTPPESTVNLLEVIASEDVLKTNVVINSVTTEAGETQYYITGVKDDIVRVPARVVERPPPRPPRNVPPCECAVQQIFTKGLTSKLSQDNIPWIKDEGLCFGKKFRPDEYPAYSCKKYPGDKSCRRNPFIKDIRKLKRRMELAKQKEQQALHPTEKKMYSIADYPPCGDEHGMGICGGPWGALHTLTPEELAAQEKLRKQILRGPPCGTKPGRAVCEGPFGTRVEKKRQQIEIEEIPGEEDEDLEDEEELEEEEQKEEPVEEKKEKKRHKKCYMSPESIAGRKKVVEKKVEKFIPDPTYPGYDDPWNIYRTAPSQKPSETDFKSLLKLSTPEPKALLDESEEKVEEPSLQKDVSKSTTTRSTSKIPPKESRKHISIKSKSAVKIAQKRPKSIDRRGVQEIFHKDTKKQTRSKEKISSEVQDKRLTPKPSKPQSKTDDKGEGRKMKPSRSKSSQQKISGKTTSFSNLKKENYVHSKERSLKQPDESTKFKSKAGKVESFPKNVSKKSDSEARQDGKLMSLKSKNNAAFNKKSKQKMDMLVDVENDDPDREETGMKQLSQQRISARGSKIKKRSTPFNLRRPSRREFRRKSSKRDKKKDLQTSQDVDVDVPPKKLKEIMMSSELYPHDIKPVELPDVSPTKCKVAYEDKEDVAEPVHVDEDGDAQLPSRGPCGWRTKSEQNLPTKKTLVYLTEPDYPQEMVPVRPGGRPCVCRENREKKKILMYNIGGLIGGKKDDAEIAIQKQLLKKKKDEEDKRMQVIDGIFYYTPPPSPRRSDEYVPEYDLYESPYDMCLTKRKDKNLKIMEQYSGPKSIIEKSLKFTEPCGCNEYIDMYGIRTLNEDEEKKEAMKELNKTRQELIEAKSPKDRWKLALNDVGLIDYFTRCRDALPCWLKCTKFDRVSCPLRQRKLKVKRPVCECKYERKILEDKEEKMKWKERRQRLKSLKKQPFMKVDNVSKPVVTDTKLMISGVKRIPREDEYLDDVKYCITGVAENYTQLPSKQIVGGVQMSTPIQTPEQSVEELSCVCLHRHWSPVYIPPGPLPKPEEIRLAEEKRRREASRREYEQIYAPQKIYDTHIPPHSCAKPCNSNSDERGDESVRNDDKELIQDAKTNADNRSKKKPDNPSKQTKQQTKLSSDNYKGKLDTKNVTKQKNPESTKESLYNTETVAMQKSPELRVSKFEENKNVKTTENVEKSIYNPHKPEYKNTEKDTPVQNAYIESGTRGVQNPDEENNEVSEFTESNLMTLAKQELKKMATEGFLFAKLPKCFLLPQLKYWLMYREGIALSSTDKNNSMRHTIMMWNIIDIKSNKIDPSPIGMTKLQLRNLNFDDAKRMKEKIAKKKATFHSKIRKARVLYARSMWNTMEYGKYPSTSFKRAYFTYMASKEADGHVFRPWLQSEVR